MMDRLGMRRKERGIDEAKQGETNGFLCGERCPCKRDARARSLPHKKKKILQNPFPLRPAWVGSLLVLDSRYSKAGSTSPFPLSMMVIFYFLPLLFLYSSPRLSDARLN